MAGLLLRPHFTDAEIFLSCQLQEVVACVQVVAQGSCHSNEGLKLEELALRAEDAQLLVKGSLLGPSQDATLELSDFPVAMLQPAFRCLPFMLMTAPHTGDLCSCLPFSQSCQNEQHMICAREL